MAPIKKIKIVHIIPTLHLGGAERILTELLRFGDRDTYDFSVITIVDGGPLENDIRKLGVPYYALRKSTDMGLGMLLELTRLLNRLDPDIVHTHLFGAHLWGQVASLLNRVPVLVASEQNTDVDLGELRHRIKKVLSFSADVMVAASNAVRDFLIAEERIASEKIVVIRNAIDTSHYGKIPPPHFEETLRMISIGRLEPQKGHDILFEALSSLQFPWKLTLVGQGSLADDLADRAVLLRINEHVHFVGEILDVSPLIAEADVVVMPSRWEGIGLVIMEGMAAGRPVVASQVGGIPELLTHGETGFLVPPENPVALAEMLTWVWEHPKEAREIGLRARAHAHAACDVREMVKKYEQLYAHFAHQ